MNTSSEKIYKTGNLMHLILALISVCFAFAFLMIGSYLVPGSNKDIHGIRMFFIVFFILFSLYVVRDILCVKHHLVIVDEKCLTVTQFCIFKGIVTKKFTWSDIKGIRFKVINAYYGQYSLYLYTDYYLNNSSLKYAVLITDKGVADFLDLAKEIAKRAINAEKDETTTKVINEILISRGIDGA